MSDHYETLGVSPDCTDEELKRAYRKLARQHHPDANPGDTQAEARFKEIRSAYEVLSDPKRRSFYDRYGTDDPSAASMSDPFSGGLGGLFDAFFGGDSPFGGGQRRSGPPRGEDLETHVDLDLQDVIFGAEREVQVRTAVRCEECQASGVAPGTQPIRCGTCQGTGQVTQVAKTMLGQFRTVTPCNQCRGEGEVIKNYCPTCEGNGRRIEEHDYPIKVPVGVDDGTTLRLESKGAVGPRGGPAGDLFVRIRVRPHERFKRDGDHLVHDYHIGFTQAALGSEFEYETFDGTQPLKIPAGTEAGTEIRLKGKGVPNVRTHRRGDIYVRVVVDIPDDLTPEQADLIRQLAELRGEDVAEPSEGLFDKVKSAFR